MIVRYSQLMSAGSASGEPPLGATAKPALSSTVAAEVRRLTSLATRAAGLAEAYASSPRLLSFGWVLPSLPQPIKPHPGGGALGHGALPIELDRGGAHGRPGYWRD